MAIPLLDGGVPNWILFIFVSVFLFVLLLDWEVG